MMYGFSVLYSSNEYKIELENTSVLHKLELCEPVYNLHTLPLFMTSYNRNCVRDYTF